MKKNIIKTFLFIYILIILMFILSFIFSPKNNSKVAGMEEEKANGFLAEEPNSIDAIILGDSESYTCIIAKEVEEKCGITLYEAGTAGQILPDTLIYLSKIYKNQKPKRVILETNIIYTNTRLSAPIIKTANIVMPIFKYHDRWKKITKDDFKFKKHYTWKDKQMGYYGSDIIDSAENIDYMNVSDEIQHVSMLNSIYVSIINSYCKKNESELILLSSPSIKNWSYQKHNGIEELAKKENINYIDLNLKLEEMNFDWQTDTRDKGDHLNNNGAKKITNYVCNLLNESKI